MLVWVDISGAGRRKDTVDDRGPGRDGVRREDDENVREVVVDVRVNAPELITQFLHI